ncbi:HNH endonuclease signature motif containing protein [Bacillus wiedmannii]|uniref:Cell division protein n=1 Tax=Bacillus wiedmannii TaxID=1890302 RepID=A0A2A8BN35_9BACI|nr:HNH endonuclease signature motif containing protein [Bacillus wiedmannii]PEM55338.1 cell division protein [Bacillus wiedmannii]PGA99439.1 cell division protein [Bacillus wiedmannii]
MEQENPSRSIPQQIQREVRQRCGFGCVICGFPIYDYDHMKEWSKVKEHIAEDITLLCPEHHREVTSGILPREVVIKANESPFNLRQGHSKPMGLYYAGDTCEFLIGGNQFTMDSPQGVAGQMAPIMVDGMPLLNFIFIDGHLLLNVQLYDENNEVILYIKENQLVYGIETWDIQMVGKTLTIREKARKILVNMTFETPNKVIIDKARLLFNGAEILIKKNVMLIGNDVCHIQGTTFSNIPIGVCIGNNPYTASVGVYLTHVNRYLKQSDEASELEKDILNETLKTQ